LPATAVALLKRHPSRHDGNDQGNRSNRFLITVSTSANSLRATGLWVIITGPTAKRSMRRKASEQASAGFYAPERGYCGAGPPGGSSSAWVSVYRTGEQ